jgi:hypothetical protein
MRLAVVADAALLERCLHLAIMLVGDQVGDRLAKVPQELDRWPSELSTTCPQAPAATAWIVAAALFELGDHVVGPILRALPPSYR